MCRQSEDGLPRFAPTHPTGYKFNYAANERISQKSAIGARQDMSLNFELLRKHIGAWKAKLSEDPGRAARDSQQRADRVAYYRAHDAHKIRAMTAEEFYFYISKLWAMLIWGNKKYVVDKL